MISTSTHTHTHTSTRDLFPARGVQGRKKNARGDQILDVNLTWGTCSRRHLCAYVNCIPFSFSNSCMPATFPPSHVVMPPFLTRWSKDSRERRSFDRASRHSKSQRDKQERMLTMHPGLHLEMLNNVPRASRTVRWLYWTDESADGGASCV